MENTELRYYIIEEIVSHALSYFPEFIADPEDNEFLSELGHEKVNYYLIHLYSFGIVTYDFATKSNKDFFGWIDYSLTDRGIDLAKTGELRNTLKKSIRIPIEKLSDQIQKFRFDIGTTF